MLLYARSQSALRRWARLTRFGRWLIGVIASVPQRGDLAVGQLGLFLSLCPSALALVWRGGEGNTHFCRAMTKEIVDALRRFCAGKKNDDARGDAVKNRLLLSHRKDHSRAFCTLKCFFLRAGLQTSFDAMFFAFCSPQQYVSALHFSTVMSVSLWGRSKLSHRLSRCALPTKFHPFPSVPRLAKTHSYTHTTRWISETGFCPCFDL